MGLLVFFITLIPLISGVIATTSVRPEIRCQYNAMEIFVPKEGVSKAGLEKWSSMPGCGPTVTPDGFLISLKLTDELPCGTTKIRNKLTSDTYFYHKIFVEDTSGVRKLYKVSCFAPYGVEWDNRIVKRNVLPAEFVEPDYIEITSEISGTAPVPELTVQVRQNGLLIGEHVTVSPGAPLSMEIYLDSTSASTYGILVSYLMVTDTTDKNETIVFNGCAQDAYIFENFVTNTGDFLSAKFKAFKFPESNYLMFKGTVDVCLDRCQGIRCSNGEIGYGRKKRSIPSDGADPNRVYQVTMMTFIKVGDTEGIEEEALEFIEHQAEEDSRLLTRSREPFFRKASHGTESPPFTVFTNAGLSSPTPSLLWALFTIVALVQMV